MLEKGELLLFEIQLSILADDVGLFRCDRILGILDLIRFLDEEIVIARPSILEIILRLGLVSLVFYPVLLFEGFEVVFQCQLGIAEIDLRLPDSIVRVFLVELGDDLSLLDLRPFLEVDLRHLPDLIESDLLLIDQFRRSGYFNRILDVSDFRFGRYIHGAG